MSADRDGPFAITANRPGGALLNDQVSAIFEDRDERLWIGTHGGLNCLDLQTGSITGYQNDPLNPMSLSGNWIRSIYQDRSGIIWIGTVKAGINKLNPDQKKFSHYRSIPGRKDSLGSNLVYSFLEAPSGILWIGTLDGLDRLDRESNSYEHFRFDPGKPGTLSQISSAASMPIARAPCGSALTVRGLLASPPKRRGHRFPQRSPQSQKPQLQPDPNCAR